MPADADTSEVCPLPPAQEAKENSKAIETRSPKHESGGGRLASIQPDGKASQEKAA